MPDCLVVLTHQVFKLPARAQVLVVHTAPQMLACFALLRTNGLHSRLVKELIQERGRLLDLVIVFLLLERELDPVFAVPKDRLSSCLAILAASRTSRAV